MFRPTKKNRAYIPDMATAQRYEKMELRPLSNKLYHCSRWKKESKAFRELHPLCEECKKKGITTPAEVTDHIIPFPICDFWDRTNWQGLCKRCNIIKGNKDKILINKHLRGEL